MSNEQLRTLAQAAIKQTGHEEPWYLLEDLQGGFYIQPDDMPFVAAASPDVVLSLLDENQRLRSALEEITKIAEFSPVFVHRMVKAAADAALKETT